MLSRFSSSSHDSRHSSMRGMEPGMIATQTTATCLLTHDVTTNGRSRRAEEFRAGDVGNFFR